MQKQKRMQEELDEYFNIVTLMTKKIAELEERIINVERLNNI